MATKVEFKQRSSSRRKRKGVHAKAKSSKLKSSKKYVKKYRSQGR